jgi:hypothetical protein
MTSDELLDAIHKQNDVVIGLLARLVWTPEKLAEMVSRGKRNLQAYQKAYNSLDGITTGKHLASLAAVSQQIMAVTLKAWQDMGIVLNVGTDNQPRYKRLMSIPITSVVKTKASKNGKR